MRFSTPSGSGCCSPALDERIWCVLHAIWFAIYFGSVVRCINGSMLFYGKYINQRLIRLRRTYVKYVNFMCSIYLILCVFTAVFCGFYMPTFYVCRNCFNIRHKFMHSCSKFVEICCFMIDDTVLVSWQFDNLINNLGARYLNS